MNRTVSRLPFMASVGLLLSALLTACSSNPNISHQYAPGTVMRPILSADEASTMTMAHYFAPVTADQANWTPVPVMRPSQADFTVSPPGTPGAQFTSVQSAVNAAIEKHSDDRLYIAIMPGHYSGTVFIPKASNSITLYGTGDTSLETVISLSIDGAADATSWQQAVNPDGRYLPGDPAWYMYQSCAQRQPVGALCSAVVWSQNDGLQLQNLTVENHLSDSVDEADHPAVALRSDGDRTQLDQVNLLSRQNTLLITNSDIGNRFLDGAQQPRMWVTHSYLEGDTDMVAGRGRLVISDSRLQLVNTRTTYLSLFAPATLASQRYGFLVENSQLNAPSGSLAQLGRNWDEDAASAMSVINGQIVIRDSAINDGFNQASPWGNAAVSDTPFSGNIGKQQGGELSRDINDGRFNRMWEYRNHGTGSEVMIAPVKGK